MVEASSKFPFVVAVNTCATVGIGFLGSGGVGTIAGDVTGTNVLL